MDEAILVHVYGRHTLTNQLFGRAVEGELGVRCVVHRTFECAGSPRLGPVLRSVHVVDDTDETARERLLRFLSGIQAAAAAPTALFNVERNGVRVREAVRCGLRGIFLAVDPVECVVEGLYRLLEGRSWIPSTMVRPAIPAISGNRSDDEARVPLTLRELQVLSLVADGQTNEQIAFTLKISPHTVKTHLYNIFQKLGVASRLNAVMWALRNFGGNVGALRGLTSTVEGG